MEVQFSYQEIVDDLLLLYVKHKPTMKMMEEYMKLINKVLGGRVFPDTKYLLHKMFSKDSSATYHLECKSCRLYGFKYQLNTEIELHYECFRCGHHNNLKKPKVIFVTFPIKPILEMLVQRFSDHLIIHAEIPAAFPMDDVFNGKLYRETVQKHGPVLAVGTNTDGIQRFKSSRDSLWPQFLTLYNIPPIHRMKEQNIAITALFNGRQLEMEYFYSEFVSELSEINKNGGIETKKGKLPVFCLNASLDSIARPKLQNHNQFNGFYGCSFCYTKGESLGGSMKYPMRYYLIQLWAHP